MPSLASFAVAALAALAAASSASAAWADDIVGTYSAVFPTTFPKGSFLGVGQLVLKADNTYESYKSYFCKPGTVCPAFKIAREIGNYTVVRPQSSPYPRAAGTRLGAIRLLPSQFGENRTVSIGLTSNNKKRIVYAEGSGYRQIKQTLTAECSVYSRISCEGGRCGGFIRNPFQCAEGLRCQLNGIPDVGGVCIQPSAFESYYVVGQFSRIAPAEVTSNGIKSIIINADHTYDLVIGPNCAVGSFCIQIVESQSGSWSVSEVNEDSTFGTLNLVRSDENPSSVFNFPTVTGLRFAFAFGEQTNVTISTQVENTRAFVPEDPGFVASCGFVSGVEC